MFSYVMDFNDIDRTKLRAAGGKGANLGELTKIAGIQVPEGFCITTEAYKVNFVNNEEYCTFLNRLSAVKTEEQEKISDICTGLREFIEKKAIPEDILDAISSMLKKYVENNAYAVRSSATAEDLPTASFAGQQDTYINIIGKDAIFKHISKCWASLFTERAVTYRIQNDVNHGRVYMSVVIQKMINSEAAGILFTADPVTGNRKVLSIDASYGLGEALVSGLVDADNYKVREGKIIEKKISAKKMAIRVSEEGGTRKEKITAERQRLQTLTDQQILWLEDTGRRIEAYFGCPQDIEWCLYQDQIYVVQSRPITTLYPIPDTSDGKNHVYMSLGHRQMMTEAMKPLGLSYFQAYANVSNMKMVEAGDRLFIDINRQMASPFIRKSFVKGLGIADSLMQNAVKNLLKRKDYVKTLHRGEKEKIEYTRILGWFLMGIRVFRKNDPAIVNAMMEKGKQFIQKTERSIANLSNDALFDFMWKDMVNVRNAMYENFGILFASIYASTWINKNIKKWLGEKNAASILTQSVPNNVTSEMGLDLMDVADEVRKYPSVIEYFKTAEDESFFEKLEILEGGKAVSHSIQEYLNKYGMRCSGEIDITRPRWNEKPTLLIPMILSNVNAFAPNAHSAKFEQGLQEAGLKEQDILQRLRQLPGGKRKAGKTEKRISVLRNFMGFREYDKYLYIWYFWVVKQALLKEADRLMEKGNLLEREDIYYLTFEEFREAVKHNHVDYALISQRKEKYEANRKLTPPRIITSDGEIISGEYDTGSIPVGALAGLPVSSGIVEGRARVILKMENVNMEKGDILVTTFTDPSWTPVFVSIQGLVTEVGGMMTHGAVIAREYGLPAVVGVDKATKIIKDGQRIRVNAVDGYVEIL